MGFKRVDVKFLKSGYEGKGLMKDNAFKGNIVRQPASPLVKENLSKLNLNKSGLK